MGVLPPGRQKHEKTTKQDRH
eukprot:COSAG01_NODE_61430_length_289_cov_1.552632_1_plen_20_part_01